mmetsp:Transcript_4654/g.12148  ORF Transcript_4654/g.12148 Transcript_4654/m.12148 type:complete len:220 (-) Transcript_4654:219-878(-)
METPSMPRPPRQQWGMYHMRSFPLEITRELGIGRIEIMIELPRVLLADLIHRPQLVELLQPLAHLEIWLKVVWRLGQSGERVHEIREERLQLIDGALLQLDGVHRRDEVLHGLGHRDGHGIGAAGRVHGLRHAHLEQALRGARAVHVVDVHELLDGLVVGQGRLLLQAELRDELVALRRVLVLRDGVARVGAFQVLRGQDDGVQRGLVVVALAFAGVAV